MCFAAGLPDLRQKLFHKYPESCFSFFYNLILTQENNILKFAQRDMDFSSYGIAPYENRNIQMSFWLPTKGNPLYLAYGPLASPNQQLPFGQKLMQNFEGALKIDVSASKVSDSK